jgi:spore coat polysaccharide biosynthesis protein SpsF
MSERKIVAIIQARMLSTRLPGKVLMEIRGEPMLVWVVERTRLAETVDQVVVAATIDPADDPLERLCAERGYDFMRGDPVDVLDRYREAADAHRADIIVRVTADCPLIDPALIDMVVEAFLASDPPADFAANRLPWDRTYPIGLDVEVCTRDALQIAWEQAREAHQREHVMPFLYEHPDQFRIMHLRSSEDLGALRWTVDTEQDMQFVRELSALLSDGLKFGWREVLALVRDHPELALINADVKHKTHQDVG